jgi:hypothetical protein
MGIAPIVLTSVSFRSLKTARSWSRPPLRHRVRTIKEKKSQLKSLALIGHAPKHDSRSSRAWLYGKLLTEKLIRVGREISPRA